MTTTSDDVVLESPLASARLGRPRRDDRSIGREGVVARAIDVIGDDVEHDVEWASDARESDARETRARVDASREGRRRAVASASASASASIDRTRDGRGRERRAEGRIGSRSESDAMARCPARRSRGVVARMVMVVLVALVALAVVETPTVRATEVDSAATATRGDDGDATREPTATDAGAVTAAEGDEGTKPTRVKRRKKSMKKAVKKPAEEEEEFKPYDPELGQGESAVGSIHEAIDDDDMEELEDLLRWKPNLREKCQKLGETRHMVPIMKAAYLGNAKALDMLLDYGANVNEMDSLGYSVLMRSVLSKCVECVKILVEAGAVVNYVQKNHLMDLGLTAPKLAQLMGEEEIAQILRDSGADEQETGAERKRRLRKEKGEQFKEHVMNEGIDVDVDSLLNTTVDDFDMKHNTDIDVNVHSDGTNMTMKQTETKDYSNLDEKLKQAKERDAKARACAASGETEGECAAFVAQPAEKSVKDEL